MRTVLICLHEDPEQPGLIDDALADAGVPRTIVNTVEHPDGVPTPDQLEELAGLVILGGPMGAGDGARYPSLDAETTLGIAAATAGIPVLGVCLGHQMLGRGLGGNFQPASVNEFGVLPVTRCAPDPLLPGEGVLPALLWHHDQVGLPPGATLLATGETVPNQAFRWGSAIGVQFHIELDLPLLDRWLADSPVASGLGSRERTRIRSEFTEAEPQIHAYVRPGLATWAAACAARVSS